MIGTEEKICPLCSGSMSSVFETEPHDFSSGVCLECGYCYWTEIGVISLEGLNEEREIQDLEPLKELKIDLEAVDQLRLKHGLKPMKEASEEWRKSLKRIKREVISQYSPKSNS